MNKQPGQKRRCSDPIIKDRPNHPLTSASITMRNISLLALASILKLTSLVSAAPTSAAGSLTAVTMNVAGLPAILNGNGEGDKKANSVEIGKKLAEYNYDVINVQEVSYRPHSQLKGLTRVSDLTL